MTGTGAPNRMPATMADVPDVAKAAMVVVVRPSRSAMAPGDGRSDAADRDDRERGQ